MTQPAGNEKPLTHQRFFGFDHLSAWAIMFVFVFHYGRIVPHPEWTNSLTKFGWTGVDLFFVLSGYLISAQLFAGSDKGDNLSFKTFFLKRVFRIMPAYFLV